MRMTALLIGAMLVGSTPACGGSGSDDGVVFSDALQRGEDGYTPPEGEDGWVAPDGVAPGPDSLATPDSKPEPQAGPCNYLDTPQSISDLASSYTAGAWKETLVTLMERRYAPGQYILTHVQDQSQLPMFVQTGSFASLVQSASTAVHEMDHLYGWELGGWTEYGYFLCPEKIIKVSNIKTPNRSCVYDLLPKGIGGLLMDYADLYLTGQMGAQGLQTLLDELNAYTHSIFIDYQLADQLPGGVSISSLDGLAAFMLFTELYFKWVRENQPQQYDAILAASGIREVVLLLWDRAEWIIDASADKSNTLQIMADPVLDVVFGQDAYSEIVLLRD